jgi:hypothetical protein
MNDHCPVCATLWREYTAATHAHIAMESKLDIARLQNDREGTRRLLAGAQAALDHRKECRRRVDEHRRQAHTGDNATAASV